VSGAFASPRRARNSDRPIADRGEKLIRRSHARRGTPIAMSTGAPPRTRGGAAVDDADDDDYDAPRPPGRVITIERGYGRWP
jgi:hypothetical protein